MAGGAAKGEAGNQRNLVGDAPWAHRPGHRVVRWLWGQLHIVSADRLGLRCGGVLSVNSKFTSWHIGLLVERSFEACMRQPLDPHPVEGGCL